MLDAILEGSSEPLLSLIPDPGEGGTGVRQDSLTSLEKSSEGLKKRCSVLPSSFF